MRDSYGWPMQEDEDYMIDSDLEDELYAMINDRDQARPQPQVAAPQQAAAGREGPASQLSKVACFDNVGQKLGS